MKTFIIGLSLLTLISWCFATPIVQLSVKERANISRINEPITVGVPLPESLYTDTSVFALKDQAGSVIPCEFRTATKWWRDKQSIRWLHLDFQTNINANEKKMLVLHNEPGSHPVAGSKLSVVDQGAKIQVTTGPLRFTIKKQNFNLFDEAWIDETGGSQFDAAHQVIATHNKGFSLLSGSTRYYSSNDASTTAVIERAGPMSAVIRVEGRLKNSGGTAMYYFACRIYAYNNSKIVKVVFSFENRDANTSSYVAMHGLNLEVPLSLSSYNVAMGAKSGTKTATVSGSQAAFLNILGIDSYAYGGVLTGSGNTRYDQSNDMGFLKVSDGQKGVGVHNRWFWQLYPSSIEVNGSGLLNVGLFSHRFTGGSTNFPPRFPNHYRIYSGMGRTHEIRFAFFNDDSDDEIRSQLIGAQSRLYAVAPAVWYCRSTQCFGPLVEQGKSNLYYPAQWGQVQTPETSMWNAGQKCLGNTNALIAGKDGYDYLCWGTVGHFVTSPGAVLYNHNYYDLPFLFFQHFARNIDRDENKAYAMLDYAHAHTTHIQDLHQCHFEPNNGNDGACRYCPPTNHIGQDALSPAVMSHTSHHKTQSMFFMHYLMGEERAEDVALRGVKWIKAKGTSVTNAYHIEMYARRIGHVYNTLIAGYKHNFDGQCLTNLSQNLTKLISELGGGGVPVGSVDQRWMTGLMTESLVDGYYLTGNEQWATTTKQVIDNTTGGMNSNTAYSMAFCARHFNNMQYLNAAYQRLVGIGNGLSFSHHEKDYAERCKSVLMSFFFFAIPDSANDKQISVELQGNSGDGKVPSVIHAYPNPFKPATTIRISEKLGISNYELRIYDVQGQLVQSLPVRKNNIVSWDAAAMPAGVYILKAKGKDKSLQKKIILMR
jgi:hypothetical protein